MASLVEELISVLQEENKEYLDLIILSGEKTNVIVKGDVEYLSKITEAEQSFISRITKLERKREEIVTDIGTVLCKDPKTLTVKVIIGLLKGQKKEQEQLSLIYDEISATVKKMVAINDFNKSLINQSLELIEFDLNLLQGSMQEPETANYGRDAYNTSYTSTGSGAFDAKQ